MYNLTYVMYSESARGGPTLRTATPRRPPVLRTTVRRPAALDTLVAGRPAAAAAPDTLVAGRPAALDTVMVG